MAARRTVYQPQKVRDRIQTSQIINRLSNHMLGEVEMTATQIKAAEILLRKSLPDLTAVALTGENGGPVQIGVIERRIVDANAPD